jgi:hypothetical protein
VNDCINIVHIIHKFIFPANGAGKLPPDTEVRYTLIPLGTRSSAISIHH